MAKKKNKARSVPSNTPRMYGDGRPSNVARTPAAGSAAASSGRGSSAAPQAPARSQAGMAAEYKYVVHDLRRLGIQAAATFAVLIILGFVIR